MNVDAFEARVVLPTRILFRNVEGEPVYLDLTELPFDGTNIGGDMFIGGLMVVLNNTFNSGGADIKPAERMASVSKRWDSWKRGEWRNSERAVSQTALMREAYVEEQRAKYPESSLKDIEGRMAATVKDAMGEKTKATFDNFLQSLAASISKRKGEDRSKDAIYQLLCAKYEKAGAELEAKRAKAAASIKIDLTDVDI